MSEIFKKFNNNPNQLYGAKKKKIVKPSRTWQKLSISKHILTKKLEWYIATPVRIYKLIRDKANM
jgi:hypothetical protein